VIGAFLLLAVVDARMVLRTGGQIAATLMATTLMILCIGIVIGYWLYFHNARLIVQDDQLTMRTAMGHEHRLPLGSIGGIALCHVLYGMIVTELVLIVDNRSRTLLTLSGKYWEPRRMHRLANELKVHWIAQDRVVGGRELNEMFPSAVPWWKVHSTFVVISVAMVIVLGAAIIAAPKG
jgi:hypothetical protein